jgi:hypothetical protein
MKPFLQKVEDSLKFVTDSLEAHPFLKGGIPAIAGAGISFIDELEAWLRLGSLIFGFLIGAITLYLTIRKALREHDVIK